MAIVILGGLVTATLINLFVLPSLYLAFGKSEARAGGGEIGGSAGYGRLRLDALSRRGVRAG